MIYSNLTVTISGGESRVNEKIILYRGDRDIQVSFEIVQASFRFGKGENIINTRKAGYGQLIIDKPDDTYTFSEMTPCDDGLVVFTITSDMIDELTEVGLYSMQIRLFDETGQSRITLPPINDAIEVREPIATEDISEIGEVGIATVDYAVLNGGEETEDIFDDEGMYKIMYWNTGDIITEGRLNRTEDAIYETNSKVENIVIPDTSDFITESEVEAKGYLTSIPSEYVTDTELNAKGYLTSIPSEYVTDTELTAKGYLTQHQSLTNYATKSYVDEAINALRTELISLINSGGVIKTPIDISETYPIANSYLYADGTVYEDTRGRGMYSIPLSDYSDFYITATSLYSSVIMIIYNSSGTVLGTKGNKTDGDVTWTDRHIVVSDLLEEYPTAHHISLSSFTLSSADTVLIVKATPV